MHKLIILLYAFFCVNYASLNAWDYNEVLVYNPKYNDQQLKDKENIVHIAVIGSGVAGLSSFIYGARAGFHTVLFQGHKPGGLVMDAPFIENWPGVGKLPGVQIIEKLEQQAQSFCPYMLPETIVKVDFSRWPFKLITSANTEINALSVVIATGAYVKRLGIEGEDTYWRKGVLACTTCDAPFSKRKRAVVVGNNETAIERALQLAPYASAITIITRDNKLKAAPGMQNKLKAFRKIQVLFKKKITKIQGNGKQVTNIELLDLDTHKVSTLKTDLVFVSGALQPNSELFRGQLPIDDDGTIMVQCRSQETSIPGITAAGTVADSRYRQAGVASGDGIKAALDDIRFLCQLGFDGPRRLIIEKQLYQPQIQHYKPLMAINTQDEFMKLLRTTSPLVIEFYSPLCSVCKHMEPVIGKLSNYYANKAKFYKIDITRFAKLVDYYWINALPTLIIFKNGQPLAKIEGEKNPNQVYDFFKKYIESYTL